METVFRPAQNSDISALCTTFARSFWDDPVMRWLFPDDDVFSDGTVMKDFFRRLLAHQYSTVTSDVVAFALWIPPGRPEVVVEPTSSQPPSDDLLEKFIALRGALEKNTPHEEHWYLQMIGTHPDWQRKGLGSHFIREGLERAREDGLGVYLETETVENVAFYQHHGFRVRSEWDVHAGGPHMWGMWCPAP